MKILIIEDDESVRTMLVTLLRDQFEIAAARDGEEGIKMIEEFKPQLVITDFQMPKKNGIDVIQYICLSKLNIKTIIASADAGCIEPAAKAAGADIVIGKPFSSEEILNAIDILLS